MFAPGHGTTAIFLGLTYISSVILNNELGSKHLKMLQQYKLPEKWFEKSVRYQLDFVDTMYDLSERLIIEWGKSTVSGVQKQDKPVIEIRAKHSIGEFISYDDVQLSYKALVQLNNNTNANPTRLNALSSVNGVYLIQHQIDGQMYVGSAYGVDGIWGRWKTYAQTGHGGNKLLKELNPDEFIFSILEIAPAILVERFNRTVRHEWLNQFLFNSIEHAQETVTCWKWSYNNEQPHTAIGGVPPRQKLVLAC